MANTLAGCDGLNIEHTGMSVPSFLLIRPSPRAARELQDERASECV